MKFRTRSVQKPKIKKTRWNARLWSCPVEIYGAIDILAEWHTDEDARMRRLEGNYETTFAMKH